MILLTARDIARQFDRKPVFQNVGFQVRPGEKIGLVGPNGSGKTTLLNVLAGLDEPDLGQIERHPTADVGLLEQEADFPADRTLLEEAKSGLAHLYELQQSAGELAEQIASQADAHELKRLQRRYDELQTELRRQNAYNIDHRVEEVLTGLGFRPDEYERPLRTFSGGQQSRALLARLLLRSPELMLLDEPTNHLDIEATEWLEGHLAASQAAVLLVSHDRYFLDRTVNRIFELYSATLTDYRGNFSAYWQQRAERNKVQQRTYEKQQEFVTRTEDFIRRNKYGQKHAQASDREKKLERLEPVAPAMREISGPSFQFGYAARTGDWVIDAVDVEKGFDEPLFSELTVRVERGDRLGIFGPNGSGKTTLLRTLLGELSPDQGMVRLGAHVKVGYFDQQLETLDHELDAIEAIRPPGKPQVTPGELRKLLAGFGIRGEVALQKIASMSGGEKSKVALARLAAIDANVLVLDEPTNHLDLWARDSLEQSLQAFEGTLLFVSHDRYFLDRVAQSVIVLEPQRWRLYEGNYSDYVEFVRHQLEEARSRAQTASHTKNQRRTSPSAAAGAGKAGKDSKPPSKRRFPYRKVDDLEDEIAEKEQRVEQLEADLVDPQVQRDGEKAKAVVEEYESIKQQLQQLYEHWEEAVELN